MQSVSNLTLIYHTNSLQVKIHTASEHKLQTCEHVSMTYLHEFRSGISTNIWQATQYSDRDDRAKQQLKTIRPQYHQRRVKSTIDPQLETIFT